MAIIYSNYQINLYLERYRFHQSILKSIKYIKFNIINITPNIRVSLRLFILLKMQYRGATIYCQINLNNKKFKHHHLSLSICNKSNPYMFPWHFITSWKAYLGSNGKEYREVHWPKTWEDERGGQGEV